MKTETQRYYFIDFLRATAILCVVLCHSVEAVFTHNAAALQALPPGMNVFRITAFTIGRSFGVPFFLMITGFLMLDKPYSAEQIRRFYLYKWLRLVICTVFWFFVYGIFLRYYAHRNLSWTLIIRESILMYPTQSFLGHQWYMPMIIGYYIMIPFVANSICSMKMEQIRLLVIPLLIVLALASGVPLLNEFLELTGHGKFSSQVNMGFAGGVYGLFIIVGVLIKKGLFHGIKTGVLFVGALLSLFAAVVFQCLLHPYEFKLWYDSVFVIMASVLLFEAAGRMAGLEKKRRVVSVLSYYSFAVYLIHMMVRNVLLDTGLLSVFSLPLQVVVVEVAVLVVSILLARLIKLIPKVGAYLLYL